MAADNQLPELYKNVHYAVQTCSRTDNVKPGDTPKERFCREPRDVIMRKCLTSLFQSIEFAVKHIPDSIHTVRFFDDHSEPEFLDFLNKLIKRFSSNNIKIDIFPLVGTGVMASTRACYEWMDQEGDHLVYQVQDDFLFKESCIFEMIEIFDRMYLETESLQPLIMPFNDPHHWHNHYKYKMIERMVVPGLKQYWLTTYDLPSGFMTSVHEFRKHWDIYEKFLALDPWDPDLEPKSLNHITFEYRAYALRPFNTIAFHMQTLSEWDPYTDWKPTWDAVEEV